MESRTPDLSKNQQNKITSPNEVKTSNEILKTLLKNTSKGYSRTEIDLYHAKKSISNRKTKDTLIRNISSNISHEKLPIVPPFLDYPRL